VVHSKKRIFLVLVGALCVIIGIASIALANESTDDGETPALGWGHMGRRLAGRLPNLTRALRAGLGRRFGEDVPALAANPRMVLAYIAGKTGVPLETLHQEFKDGKTLEEIAEAYGVDWAEIEEAVACPGPGGRMSEERLEMAIERVTESIARTTERMETFQSKIPEHEARIAEIEDETLREFAQRHLDILKERHELSDDHLAILQQRLELLQDQLDYAKSR
jgi:hypothetical protein